MKRLSLLVTIVAAILAANFIQDVLDKLSFLAYIPWL